MDPKSDKELKEGEKASVLGEFPRSDEIINRKTMPNPVNAQLSDQGSPRKADSSYIDKQSRSGLTDEKPNKQEASRVRHDEPRITRKDKTSFVRAVYTIVFFQVTLTFIFSYLSSINTTLSRLFDNILVIILSYAILLGSLLIFFLTNISQVFPFNYILLAGFTISESTVIAGWTSEMKVDTIIL